MLRALRAIVGVEHVLADPDLVAGYTLDWTGRFRGSSPAVVRPGSVEETAAVIEWCAANGVAVVPQGGNTGLVGGSVPLEGEIVLSLRRLSSIEDVDRVAGQLTAGAGATLARLQRAAHGAGSQWTYAVDISARDSATVGGMVATNAGGLRVLRYGDTRAQLLGVEAVVGDGSILTHLHGLLKDNTGYHLPSLLCGSEGTLGVVTRARLRLVPRLEQRVVALVGLDSVDAAADLGMNLRSALQSLEALEFFDRACFELVGLRPAHRELFETYVLVECAAETDPTSRLSEALGDLPAAVAGPDAPARRAELWRYRDSITESINRLGPPHKLDVTLPAASLAEFCADVGEAVAAVTTPGNARTWLFGHLGDGNVHVNVTGAEPGDERVDGAVLELAASYGGSISAEHGIGTAKKRWLHLSRTPAEIATMRALKSALDPAAILNPNVLLPPA